MKNNTKRDKNREYLAIAALAGLGLLTVCVRDASAVTGDCSSTPDTCDLQQKSTILRSVIWSSATSSAPCSTTAWNTLLSKERFPFGTDQNNKVVLVSGVRAPLAFLNGVCEFHRKAGGNPDRGIAELQAAQEGRLMPAQRQAAGLFEGLLHCRKLEQVLNTYGNDWHRLEQSATARGEFCAHRAQAKTNLGNMDWVGFELGYDTRDWSLYQHVEQVATCAERYLNASYDAACQIRTQLSLEEARTVGDLAAKDVLAELLGPLPTPANGAEAGEGPISTGQVSDLLGGPTDTTTTARVVPPVTAIMARKLATANEAVEGASGQFDALRIRAAALTAGVASASSVTSQIGAVATEAAHEYEDAVRKAQEVVRLVDYWMKGFFQSDSGRDVRDVLGQSRTDLAGARSGISASPSGEGLVAKLNLVLANMQQWSQGAEREARLMRHLCAVYFCEIQGRSREAGLTTSACGTFDSVTGEKYSARNDLCLDQGAASARTLCSGVGFNTFASGDADACVAAASGR